MNVMRQLIFRTRYLIQWPTQWWFIHYFTAGCHCKNLTVIIFAYEIQHSEKIHKILLYWIVCRDVYLSQPDTYQFELERLRTSLQNNGYKIKVLLIIVKIHVSRMIQAKFRFQSHFFPILMELLIVYEKLFLSTTLNLFANLFARFLFFFHLLKIE